MLRCLWFFGCVTMFWHASAWSHQNDLFTKQERAWIAEHPVITTGVDPDWHPLEYLEGGRYKGVVIEYVKAVSRISGIEFQWVPIVDWSKGREAFLEGRIQLMPALVQDLEAPELRGKVSYTHPYFADSVMVVTKGVVPIIFNSRQLSGKKVAVKGGRAIGQALSFHPDIQTVTVDTVGQALALVADGTVYAAMGAESVIMPELRRHYFGVLNVAGSLVDVPVTASMGVLKDNKILLSIIDKSLSSLSARETDRIMTEFSESTDYGAPSLSTITQFYKWEGVAFLTGLLIISFLALTAFRAERRATRSEKEKSMFLAVMSHEVRTPMNSILASVELLARAKLSTEDKRLAKVAVSSATTLIELLNDVLDYSKMEANKLALSLHRVDVEFLIRETVSMVEARAHEKALCLGVEFSGLKDIWPVIDSHRVRQILINLLSNAIKFTENGRIDVFATLSAEPHDKTRGMLRFKVKDTGIGMYKKQQNKLFKAFTQADETITRKFGGTGLGLTICKDLVALMGGYIVMESEAGVGTTVEVILPVQLQGCSEALGRYEDFEMLELKTHANGASGALRILVVEDHPESQFVIERQLNTFGCKVTKAETGLAGLDEARAHVFDLMLLDCNLSDMDGYAVAAKIREAEVSSGSHLPIIAISAMVGPEHSKACFDAGIDGVLTKPLRLQELQEIIEMWCSVSPSETNVPKLPMKDEAQLQKLFHKSMRVDLEQLRAAALINDWRQVERLAHRILGGALIVKAQSITAACRDLEKRASTGRSESIIKSIQHLDEVIIQAESEW
ncbi:ATP-binding protein [Pseudomonas arsenicoxydans]|uniref:histidine kinase n=1 Tax=Pseudomonas arsenicoxydans TaxID=702115 RepID=A0A502I1S9_9PSED|nr:ATP-binding protein [Pseudomonas arsenicoxydans]TPG79602.1 response regulator [Pseudomonas arsenicoxydans]